MASVIRLSLTKEMKWQRKVLRNVPPYTVRAKDDAEAEKLIRDAHLLEEAGCFAIVLEKIPATLAERVASAASPTTTTDTGISHSR